MNMFQPTKATTVAEYLAAVPAERKVMIKALDDLIRKAVPKLKRHFAYNMLGYGSFLYKSRSGKPMEWPVIALANQKNYVSLYVCSISQGKYLAEQYKKDLGSKVSVGKSCIRFKKIEDIHLPTLKKVLQLAAKSPGLITKLWENPSVRN